MSLGRKIIIGVSGALFLVFFVLFEISKSVALANTPVEVSYPSGGLSDNLFVSQNSTYVQSSDLPIAYEFADVPYIIDLPNTNSADVGSGHIVQINEDMVVYITQIARSVDIHSAVLSQYPKVVYLNYSKDDSYSMTVKEESGYLNGLPTTYFVDHLLISTGKESDAKNAYVLGYCFWPETDTGDKIIISIATTVESTENFATCKELLDILAYTVRYDQKLDKAQKETRQKAADAYQKAQEKAQKEQEKEEQQRLKESASTSSTTSTDALSELTPLTPASSDGQIMSIPVSVTSDFVNLTILVTWTNENKTTNITFTSPDGVYNISPTLQTSKQATINVGAISSGEYTLKVSDYSALGEVNTKLIENGR